MKTKVKLVQLHEPLFLAGTNLGLKLVEKGTKGFMNLWHDSESDHVIVEYNGERAHIKNWASFNEDIGKKIEHINPHKDQVIPVNAQIGGPNDVFNPAQVSTPHDVTKTIRRPGRPPKYQGEDA